MSGHHKDIQIRTDREIPPEPSVGRIPARRRQRSLVWVLLLRLLIVAVAGVLVFAIWKSWNRIAPSAIFEWIEARLTGERAGEGYPLPVSGDAAVRLQPLGDSLAVLTDGALSVYNDTAAEVLRISHTYSAPLLETAGSYALIAEGGGARFQLIYKKEIACTGSAAGRILSASVNENGYIALAVESDTGYASEVMVYNAKGVLTYCWSSTEWLSADAAVSENGKQLAVAAVSAEEGAILSGILLFDATSEAVTPIASYTGRDNLLFRLRYTADGSLLAVGDAACWAFDPIRETTHVYSYDNWSIKGCALSPDGAGLVLGRYGSSGDDGRLVQLTQNAELVTQSDFHSRYRSVAARGKSYLLLTADRLYYAGAGGLGGGIGVPGDSIAAVPFNKKAAVLGLSAIELYEEE